LAVSAVVLALVPGCREEERDRPLVLEKGVYQGEPDQPLSEAQLHELRQRGLRQSF
jgi:hypothetical protein